MFFINLYYFQTLYNIREWKKKKNWTSPPGFELPTTSFIVISKNRRKNFLNKLYLFKFNLLALSVFWHMLLNFARIRERSFADCGGLRPTWILNFSNDLTLTRYLLRYHLLTSPWCLYNIWGTWVTKIHFSLLNEFFIGDLMLINHWRMINITGPAHANGEKARGGGVALPK